MLVATGLSDAADAALREGAALASGSTDALAVIHALPPLSFLKTWPPQFADDPAKLSARAAQAVAERMRGVSEIGPRSSSTT